MPGGPKNSAGYLVAAFLSGGLLTLMIHLNGELARYGNALFSSWTAHGTGTVAAIVFLLALRAVHPTPQPSAATLPLKGRVNSAPWWAYLGGISGAATVMLTSYAVNTSLALAGTLSLALAGQVAFSLAADRWGLFGLPSRLLDWRDFGAVALILAGSALIILYGAGA